MRELTSKLLGHGVYQDGMLRLYRTKCIFRVENRTEMCCFDVSHKTIKKRFFKDEYFGCTQSGVTVVESPHRCCPAVPGPRIYHVSSHHSVYQSSFYSPQRRERCLLFSLRHIFNTVPPTTFVESKCFDEIWDKHYTHHVFHL